VGGDKLSAHNLRRGDLQQNSLNIIQAMNLFSESLVVRVVLGPLFSPELKNQIVFRAPRAKHEITMINRPAIANFDFESGDALEQKTFMTQAMLEKNFLSGRLIYSRLAHSIAMIQEYLEALYPVFNVIKKCESGDDIKSLLKGPVCHSGFKRLN